MSEHCPYYTLPGGKNGRHIVIGSDHCLAAKHPMCGFQNICPGGVGPKKAVAPSQPEDAAEANDHLDWSAVDLGEADPVEAEAPPAAATSSETTTVTDDDETLGECLRRLRNEKGFTMMNLARTVGLNPGIISKWETGINRPALSSLQKLDKVLNSDLADRFGDGLREPRKPVATSRKKKPAVIQSVQKAAVPDAAADRSRPAIQAERKPAGSRDDFVREILH